jgi:serine/threonine protein kinase/Tol biopolymer transport system component
MITPDQWERVRSLFRGALDMPSSERGSFLRAGSGGDEEVRQEVESLLEAYPRAEGFLSDPVIGADRGAPVAGLAPGTRLGRFEIVDSLGSGGMGEVYRGRDTRLDRPVAIKVLAADLAGEVRGGERLEREARLISMLTHPHVCTLYDVGAAQVDGSDVRFLVMELLDGETLAARLRRGPLPIAQALSVAIEIVEALVAAHGLGIVHRDLKPGNVVLTKSGVKLLDFGLARLRPRVPNDQQAASTREPLTAKGALVGTLPYMAPEQLRGEETDARADLFAFGAVLYETITGARAFAADSQAGLIAAILEHEPAPLTSRQPLAPPALERLVAACLAKNPDERWQTARDLLRELTWVRDNPAAPGTTRSAVAHRLRRSAWASAAALAIVLLALLTLNLVGRPAPDSRPNISFLVYPPDGTRFPRGTAEMAISPDGSRLVFVALSTEGTRHLWMRRFDSVATRMLDGTDGAHSPFWSPDSRSVAFFAQGRLKRIAEAGGSPQVVCESAGGGGGTWNREGIILFSGLDGPIWRVADTGGAAQPATTIDVSGKEPIHKWPVFLPDGRRFLYRVSSNEREADSMYQGSLDSTDTRRVGAAESSLGFVDPHLFTISNHSLIAQIYDPDRGAVVGEPVSLAEQIAMESPLRSGGAFSVSASALAYRSASPDSRLLWFDRAGKQTGAFLTPGDYQHPWLSPDETRIAVEKTDITTGRHTIWILEPSRGVTSRLISDGAGAHMPVWSPDGSRILFSSNRFGGVDLFSIRADGTGGDELLVRSSEKALLRFTDWSLDGHMLLYQTRRRGQEDLWSLPASSTPPGQPFLETPANESQAQFSPDARLIAYASDESGTQEVYVRRFPGGDGKWRVSTNGGVQPRWRRDQKELFYLALDGRLMAVDVKIGASSFEVGTPRALFNTGITASFVDRRNQYLVTREGQRFLVNVSVEDENSAPITVVLNWKAKLEK